MAASTLRCSATEGEPVDDAAREQTDDAAESVVAAVGCL
jgi:hypothetical protein